jgi:predicted transcriptional regulator
MKIDCSYEGLLMFFRDYQVLALESLWSRGESNSREVWAYVNEKINGSISRASIINFLNELVDEGLMDFTTTTGKGGHRRIYSHRFDENSFAQELVNRTISRLVESFPDETIKVIEELEPL